MDALGHVNNAKYLTYFEEARFAYWRNLFPVDMNSMASLGLIIASANLNFRNTAKVGDTLRVFARVAEFGTKSFRMEYKIENDSTKQLVAEGSTVQVMYDYARGETIPVSEEVKRKILEFEQN